MRLARLVVGDDGSQCASAAGAWADAVALVVGGQVVRVFAADSSPVADEESRADLAVSATAGLLEAADANDADLIVVGRRGAGGFGALRLGSVAHQLAEHTRRPLAVVPSAAQRLTAGGWPFATVVVGHDGSPTGAAATTWAAELAVRSRAKVVVVHAAELGPAYAAPGLDDVYRRSLAGVAARLADEWTAPLRELGVEYTTVLEDAGPASVLLDTAHVHRAELVVGRRAAGAFPGMEMGSVAHRAVGLAPCPVVVIPAAPGST